MLNIFLIAMLGPWKIKITQQTKYDFSVSCSNVKWHWCSTIRNVTKPLSMRFLRSVYKYSLIWCATHDKFLIHNILKICLKKFKNHNIVVTITIYREKSKIWKIKSTLFSSSRQNWSIFQLDLYLSISVWISNFYHKYTDSKMNSNHFNELYLLNEKKNQLDLSM